MSRGLLFIVVLTFMLVSSSIQGALATIISASLDPECGPPGTSVWLTIRFTGNTPDVKFDPDVGMTGGDVGEGIIGVDFTVPAGVHQITITISQEGSPSWVVTFCPATGSPVGGFMEPVNKLAVFAPYLALFGVLAVVVVAVTPWKKREN